MPWVVMANPLSKNYEEGSVGELLVIIRLLQYKVQASFTLKDTGNDLIGAKGNSLRTIQVKSSVDHEWKAPEPEKSYHILALVSLRGEDESIKLDESKIYLLSKQEVAERLGDKKGFYNEESLQEFLLSQARVDILFR